MNPNVFVARFLMAIRHRAILPLPYDTYTKLVRMAFDLESKIDPSTLVTAGVAVIDHFAAVQPDHRHECDHDRLDAIRSRALGWRQPAPRVLARAVVDACVSNYPDDPTYDEWMRCKDLQFALQCVIRISLETALKPSGLVAGIQEKLGRRESPIRIVTHLIGEDGFASMFGEQIFRDRLPGLIGKVRSMAALETVLERCAYDEAEHVLENLQIVMADPAVRAKPDEELALFIRLFDPEVGKGIPQ